MSDRAKWTLGGGEYPDHNLFGREYIISIASAPPVTLGGEGISLGFGDGPDDYGIWTSAPEVPPKKKAA
jgi:hypothetical protein